MEGVVLFRDRSRSTQIILGGVVPALAGALAGVLIGVAAAAYYAVALLLAAGCFVSGFEHRDGWGGADRGFWAGLIYGVSLLAVHGIIGTHAKVSLGSFPPLFAVVTTVISSVLAAAGGRLARARRERAGVFLTEQEA